MLDVRRRGSLIGAIAATVVAVIVVTGLVYFLLRKTSDGAESVPSTGGQGGAITGQWLSGASSDEAADGSFGTWRGRDVQIGGTWDNGNSEQVAMTTICDHGPWASWDKPLDVAIGAINRDQGETWAAAADGAYDDRWTQNLQKIKECWGTRDPSKLYIRFAHEMNLNTQKWHVESGEEADFVKAITRYSDLRYQILPDANLVLCFNDRTVGDVDITNLWPGQDNQGRQVADVYAVDSYNMNPHVTTTSAFEKKINAEHHGVPVGIEKHREAAEKLGVPFAISEWGNNGDTNNAGGGGESPEFVKDFYAWAASHAGDPAKPQPGQLIYEIAFNLWNQYQMYPDTKQPDTAAAYKVLAWGAPAS
jgi:hypothetical protein